MSKQYPIKICLSALALGMWIGSLFLPVMEEGGAGRGHFLSGLWVIGWTFTLGIVFLLGIPWAIMNLGLFVLFGLNVANRNYIWFSHLFIAMLFLVGLLTAALRFYYGVEWRHGVILWFGSMFFMWLASNIDPSGISRPNRRTPPDRFKLSVRP